MAGGRRRRMLARIGDAALAVYAPWALPLVRGSGENRQLEAAREGGKRVRAAKIREMNLQASIRAAMIAREQEAARSAAWTPLSGPDRHDMFRQLVGRG